MNKTITSNIAGYVFHIDENAFDKLDAYLNTIRSYFSDSQGKDEIIADIEARLAEMLQERIGSTKEVVTLADVNHVIQKMGQPEAFMEDDPESATWTEQRSEPRRTGSKRLFRDPDSRVVGGVCSGVSHYLGIGDPIWLRLALVISAIFFGTGFLLYLILWIIIPEANTTTEKLQMRGEHVTVSNIEKRVNEELETVKNKWNEFHGNSGAGRKVGNAFHNLINLLINLVTMFFKFIAKIIGFAFLATGILGFITIAALVLSFPDLVHIGSDGIVGSPMINELLAGMFSSGFQLHVFRFSILMAWGIPLLLLAYLGAKLMVNIRNKNRYVILPLIALWIIGSVSAGFIALSIQRDFAVKSTHTEVVNMEASENVIYLDVQKGEDGHISDVESFDMMFFNLWVAEDSDVFKGRPTLDVTQSPDRRIHLVIKRTGRASSKKEANQEAMTIEYEFNMKDSLMEFSPFFELPNNADWRDQSIDLELQIPEGQVVRFNKDLIKIIYDIKNVNGTYDGDMVERKWIMQSYGLECVDCKGLKDPKFRDDESDMSELEELERDLEDQQDELEREAERLERKMEKLERELEKKQEELDKEMEQLEEADGSKEILLRRVINASYQVSPTTLKRVTFSYPG